MKIGNELYGISIEYKKNEDNDKISLVSEIHLFPFQIKVVRTYNKPFYCSIELCIYKFTIAICISF